MDERRLAAQVRVQTGVSVLDARLVDAMQTRPCDFCLSFHGGSVFADFVRRGETVWLKRVSFDGFGCCTPQRVQAMSPADSKVFLEAVATNDLQTERFESLIRRHFVDNQSVLWQDALTEYGFQ